jgi:hypothetical protein
MTEAEVQRLRDAGISDAVILELQQEQEKKTTGTTSPAPAGEKSELPTIDPNTPSQVYQNAQAAGVPTVGAGPTMMQTGIELATNLPDALKYGAGGYGAYKAGQYLSGKADLARAQADLARSKIQPGPQKTMDVLRTPEAQLNQARGPVAPQGTAPTAQQPSALQRTMDYANRVKQVAMDRVITPAMEAAPRVAQAAAPLARAAGGVTAAVMPGNVGQNYPFPMSGPMRGQEINPQTGAPWTPQELTAYRAQYGS